MAPPATANRHRRGERLEDGDLQRQLAVAEQDRLDRFRNSVTTDLVGPETRDDSHDQGPDDGHDEEERETAISDVDRGPGKIAVPEDVRRKRDEPQERPGAEGAAGARDDRHRGEEQHSVIGSVIRQAARMGGG